MANTPPIAVDVRRFRWHDLSPDDGAAMIELVRSLSLDPDTISTEFAISRAAGRPWRLHLQQFDQDENGRLVASPSGRPASHPLVFADLALPDSLTREDVIDEMARLSAEVERLRAVVACAERDNCGCRRYPLDGPA